MNKVNNRVSGLDSFRFIAALTVTCYHIGPFPLFSESPQTFFDNCIHGVYYIVWNGPAAVIVFFLISGFCIHFPYRNYRFVPNWVLFCSKRILRLSIPFAAVLLLEKIFLQDYNRFGHNLWYSFVGWSLTCELLYYLSYPFLFNISKRINWFFIMIISFTVSMFVLISNYQMMHYPSYGTIGNMLLGLPCWILGVILAEKYDNLKTRKCFIIKLYIIRIIVISSSMCCYGFFLYYRIGFPITLNFFALVVFIWLSFELTRRNNKPNNFLEWGGKWSYSLYLTHWPLYLLITEISILELFPIIQWLVQFSLILIGAYIFYIIFEKTSHSIVKRIVL